MIQVVYLINQLRNSGPVRVLLNTCKYLDRERFTPVIVTLMDEDPQRSVADRFKELSIEIRDLHYSFWQLELATGQVARTVLQNIADLGECIIHAHGYHPTLIAAKIKNLPTCTTIHNICSEDYIAKKGFALGTYMSYRFRHTLSQIDYPVAICNNMKRFYSADCLCITTVYNGVDLKRVPVQREVFCRELGIDPQKRIAVVTGHLSKGKNSLFIIRELKRLPDSDFVCIFVGDGPQRELCKRLAEDDPRFVFAGYVFNVSDYLGVADLFISASLSEGLPLSVLEALNAGLPSLLSSIAPHREIVEAMNCEGVMHYPLKEGILSELFSQTYRLKADFAGIAEKAERLFSAVNMSRNYMTLYEKIFHEREHKVR